MSARQGSYQSRDLAGAGTPAGGTAPVGGTAPLGVIADDFTGATDVAVALRRAGLRTLLFFGVPDGTSEGAHAPHPSQLPEHDALVVALKSRMMPATDAVASSTAALRWLRGQGTGQIYFKFCSTFDSTPRGNIGPVLDALAEATGAGPVTLTPSSPEHLRTQYQGCLFVDDVLLGESHMRDHPVTPMTDSYLPRLLRAQTSGQVALIGLGTVRQGPAVVRAALTDAGERGARYVLADGIDESDLRTLGRAVVGAPLVAGAAGWPRTGARLRRGSRRAPIERPAYVGRQPRTRHVPRAEHRVVPGRRRRGGRGDRGRATRAGRRTERKLLAPHPGATRGARGRGQAHVLPGRGRRTGAGGAGRRRARLVRRAARRRRRACAVLLRRSRTAA